MTPERASLVQAIADYQSRYPAETNITSRFQELLQNETNCFHRDCFPAHITGSGWFVNVAGTHVLLTHHKKLNLWLQLGGHTDGNENVIESAKRETIEESGIIDPKLHIPSIFDMDIHAIPGTTREPKHEHFDIRYVFTCVSTENFILSDESHALEWVAIDKVSNYTTEISMLRMVEKWNQLT